MTDLIVTLVVLALLAGLIIIAVRRGWLMRPPGSFTGITIFHDWSNQEVQKSTEIIIERNAGKKEEDDDSGEPDFEELMRAQDMKKKPRDQQDRS